MLKWKTIEFDDVVLRSYGLSVANIKLCVCLNYFDNEWMVWSSDGKIWDSFEETNWWKTISSHLLAYDWDTEPKHIFFLSQSFLWSESTWKDSSMKIQQTRRDR